MRFDHSSWMGLRWLKEQQNGFIGTTKYNILYIYMPECVSVRIYSKAISELRHENTEKTQPKEAWETQMLECWC